MIALFGSQFFQNAFIMSLLLSVLFGFFSFFVIMRKMAFLGAGIAHTAFGGVALGILIGINPFYSSLIFCVVAAVLIGKLTQVGHVSYDTGIGIFFSFSMALGVFFIALKKAYAFDLSGYLFGNILGVTRFDQFLVLVVVLVCVPVVFGYLHKILFLTFDEKVAAVSGVPTQMLDTLLLVTLAMIIVISIKIVGIILVSALIVLPASFGVLLSKDYRKVIGSAVGYTLVIMIGGLVLSYYLDLPTGAVIVILGTLIYFITLILSKLKSS